MPRIGSNLSKWKNGQYIKCRSWWSLTTLYSNFFISSHQMGYLTKFDQNQSIGFYKHTLWPNPRWSQMEKSWIQSLLHSSSSTFGLMVNFSFGKVWTTQFWVSKEFIATHRFLEPQMVMNGKVMNTNIVPLIKIYISYIDHFCIWQSFRKV